MSPLKVLVVDDEPAIRTALTVLLDVHDIDSICAGSPQEALAMLAADPDIGLVIHDMNFADDTTSGREGTALFRSIRALDPELPVLLITAWTSVETAVALVKEGAHDYIGKPWDDDKLVAEVQSLLAARHRAHVAARRRADTARARQELAERHDLRGLVYCSRAMHEVVSLALTVAPSDAPVLIMGPNGAGKEKLAEIVQANSSRRDQPFITVNAGGLPDALLEAELFGAEPGAFTGATKRRIGRFEAAHGGTLFLDEIGNLSPRGQMKLLRVLQTGEFQRLGSHVTRTVDVRIISATNADLMSMMQEGGFREDLYYRLGVIVLELPALAARTGDVVPLAEAFLAQRPPAPSQGPWVLTEDARAALVAHDWPGNVRELKNRIQRATLVATSSALSGPALGLPEPVDARTLSDRLAQDAAPLAPAAGGERVGASGPPEPETPGEVGEDEERRRIEAAIVEAGGVLAQAARILGVSRQALYRRLDKLGISVERRPVRRDS